MIKLRVQGGGYLSREFVTSICRGEVCRGIAGRAERCLSSLALQEQRAENLQ